MAKAARTRGAARTAPDSTGPTMKQVILKFDEETKRRILEELLPAEKRKLTGQLEYLLLQERDEKQLQQIAATYENNRDKVRDKKGIAVKVGEAEFWKGQEQAVSLRLSFPDFATALLEHWAEPKASAAKG
jgi:hypothetical protein